MIKHTVQDHLHPPAVDFFYQLCKQRVACFQIFPVSRPNHIALCLSVVRTVWIYQRTAVPDNPAKMGIDMLVVLAVVFVVGGRYKHRIQINGLYPKALNVIQLIPNALQISSIKTAYIHGRRIFSPVRHTAHRLSDVNILPRLYIIVGISVAKTICKNLVHHRPLSPVRRVKARSDLKIKLRPAISSRTQAVIQAYFLSLLYFKMIKHLIRRRCDPVLIIVKVFI